MKHYRDYIWEEGIPYGIIPVEENPIQGITYKVIADPYRKWISLEEYCEGNFCRILYDSALLDFRKLKPASQAAWDKVVIRENPNDTWCLIRDQNDRVILLEHYTFEKGRCRSCQVKSPHGHPLSSQRIFYKDFGDPFDGVILYDANEKPVMKKTYKVIPHSSEFGELIEENWKLEGRSR